MAIVEKRSKEDPVEQVESDEEMSEEEECSSGDDEMSVSGEESSNGEAQDAPQWPMTDDGHKLLFGISKDWKSVLTQKPYGCGVWTEIFADDKFLDQLKKECRFINARQQKGGEEYSHGSTFWIGAGEKPECAV